SLAITPERAKQVQFSIPYAAASVVLYGATKTPIKAAGDLKGLRVGVARASTQDVAVTKAAPEGTEIRRFDDDASAMQALLSGQVDAIGCSTTVAAQIAKRAPAGVYERKMVLFQQVMGIVLRPGQAELKKEVDDFVLRNKANGELNKLYQKWLGTDFPALPNS
uniref:transporter substrate-binding domain-containing protein n=1 Tax=Variovorax sp. E3 TaxID=1914993 RepID=UPI0018DE2897